MNLILTLETEYGIHSKMMGVMNELNQLFLINSVVNSKMNIYIGLICIKGDSIFYTERRLQKDKENNWSFKIKLDYAKVVSLSHQKIKEHISTKIIEYLEQLSGHNSSFSKQINIPQVKSILHQ